MRLHVKWLLVFMLNWLRNVATDKKLQMVHVLYRHGIRAPIHFFPNDKYQEKDWPNGAGQLTQKGMYLEYKLGKFLKQRYIDTFKFLNVSYLPSQVYLRSSDVDRCLQSAQCQLAGLYPPQGLQIWHPDIPWQPIPVHTTPDDPLLRPFKNCPRLYDIRRERENSAEYKMEIVRNKKLLLNVSTHAGMELNFTNLWWITDCLLSEQAENMTTPQWALNVWNEMNNLSDTIFGNRWRGDDEMGRITGGPLLAVINKNMKKWSEKEYDGLSEYKKFNLFSAHDQTLLALSCALDIKISIPIFASCIIIELFHSSELGYFVEMWYRNDYAGKLQPLNLKKCKFRCPLNDFVKLLKDRISVDRARECGLKSTAKVEFLTPLNLKILLGVFITLSLLLLTVIVILCYNKYSVKDGTFRYIHNVHDDGFDALEIAPDDAN